MHRATSRSILLTTCVMLLLVLVPAASATPKNCPSNHHQYTYAQLTKTGDCLRPFTLLGYVDGDKMNLCTVSPRAEVYSVANPVKRTFRSEGTLPRRSRLVGDFVELWDRNGDAVVDRILVVPRTLSHVYWDARMAWLPGVGENSEPAVDDATGEALYGKAYRIPMGERQLAGYGIGDWSGVTDFSNLPNETYWPFIDYYHATSSKRLTMLTGYKTSLQVTGGTCGMASALTVLDWYGQRRDLNEKDLIALRQPNDKWGGFTSLAQLISVFKDLPKAGVTKGWSSSPATTTPTPCSTPVGSRRP